ncbi:DNA ligase [Paramecium bursaria Chlorella virus NE-JV-1]|nr:DNA ligase [Paramecium bursaria Chlorella virus NE-JV-1]
MTAIQKPLLAASFKKLTVADVKYPVFATPKLDGIRALKIDGAFVSRTFKPIRNRAIADALQDLLPNGSDGEILSGSTFQDASSAVMTAKAGIGANTIFYWFDYVKDDPNKPYLDRMTDMENYLKERPEILNDDRIKIVPLIPKKIETKDELDTFEKICLDQGFEGVMIRSGAGKYKFGRSTEKEGILIKIKQFEDDEAVVIGFTPMQTNTNDKSMNELGDMKRSSHKDGKVNLDTLGALEVDWNGITFSIGTGFDHALRDKLWSERDKLIGKIVKFKYFAQGVKTAPRFPVFIGFRDPDDM